MWIEGLIKTLFCLQCFSMFFVVVSTRLRKVFVFVYLDLLEKAGFQQCFLCSCVGCCSTALALFWFLMFAHMFLFFWSCLKQAVLVLQWFDVFLDYTIDQAQDGVCIPVFGVVIKGWFSTAFSVFLCWMFSKKWFQRQCDFEGWIKPLCLQCFSIFFVVVSTRLRMVFVFVYLELFKKPVLYMVFCLLVLGVVDQNWFQSQCDFEG